jgi:hypothetical protein
MTIEIDRLVMSILGSLEVVHLLLTNCHHIVSDITYKFTLVVHFTSGTKTYFTFVMACCE